MISVCIPVFNFDITSLVDELSRQCKELSIPTEIIIIDDGSEYYKTENKKSEHNARYIELEANIGRARIRNLFLEYAKYDYLLFLDCDSLVIRNDFLTKYLDTLKYEPEIICGGRVYPAKPENRNKWLSWKHGVYKESMPAEIRSLNPNRSFMTNNFVIAKKCLDKIRFDERIIKYGHEDTLFGYELSKNNVQIVHIDNPVLNGDIETNEVFLKKTEQGVMNLVHILKFLEYDLTFIKNVSLLNYYHKTRAFNKVQYLIYKIFKRPIHFFLKKGYVNLKLFDFYKLGVFIEHKTKEEKNS